MKPFFTNRGIIANDSITLEEDPKETTPVFNNFYTNIVEIKYCRDYKYCINSQSQVRATVKKVIESYKNHPSIVNIKECFTMLLGF